MTNRLLIALSALMLSAPAAKPSEPVTMVLPVMAFNYATTYVADARGLWGKHGVDVKTVAIPGSAGMNAVISGSVDFAQVSADTFAAAAAHGQRLLALAVLQNRLFLEVVLRKDLAPPVTWNATTPLAQRAAQLNGRTIGVLSVNGTSELFVRLLAQAAGLDPGDIRLAVLGGPAMYAALETHAIDGFSTAPPITTQAVQDGAAVVIASGPKGEPPEVGSYAFVMLVARPETCRERPPVCAGVTEALTEAAKIIRDQPSDALTIMQERFPKVSAPLVESAFSLVRASTPYPPIIKAEDIARAESLGEKVGFINKEDRLQSLDGLTTEEFVH